MKLVLVEWVDSLLHPNQWGDIDPPAVRHMRCESVGWLYKKTKKYLHLVSNTDSHGHACGAITIPRSAVRKITKLAPK